MPNKHYMKGYRKERKVVNEARAKGHLAFRSAGSHSPVDVVDIWISRRRIKLIQCKSDELSENERNRLLKMWHGLDGTYTVKFSVE